MVNVDKVAHTVADEALRGKRLVLHPVHMKNGAADKRLPAQAGAGLISIWDQRYANFF